MSRIGKSPIPVPDGVQVDIGGDEVKVKGKNGEIVTAIPAGISIAQEEGELVVKRDSDAKPVRALHGLVRALVANAVTGVTEGFKRELEIRGIGYRAAMQGSMLTMQLGFSHPVEFPAPEGVTISVPDQTKIVVEGADKQRVGETAAQIRRIRPPDAYKGKGIRYSDEIVRTKVGKSGTA